MQAFKSPIKARRPTTPRSAWRPCYMTVGAVTIIVLLVIFYSWLFRVLKGQKQGQQVLGKIEQWTGTIHQQIHPHSQPAPCANHPIANHYSLAQYGDYPQQHGAGGEDPDAWLDTIADFPPPIVPSHYALVNGEEPFEHKETGPFQLHTIPTDEWYDIAKRATDRCDLTLTNGIQGAANGLEDKVVCVSGLLDLKRGESGNKEFQRSMDEYYRRFQNILDRGAYALANHRAPSMRVIHYAVCCRFPNDHLYCSRVRRALAHRLQQNQSSLYEHNHASNVLPLLRSSASHSNESPVDSSG